MGEPTSARAEHTYGGWWRGEALVEQGLATSEAIGEFTFVVRHEGGDADPEGDGTRHVIEEVLVDGEVVVRETVSTLAGPTLLAALGVLPAAQRLIAIETGSWLEHVTVEEEDTGITSVTTYLVHRGAPPVRVRISNTRYWQDDVVDTTTWNPDGSREHCRQLRGEGSRASDCLLFDAEKRKRGRIFTTYHEDGSTTVRTDVFDGDGKRVSRTQQRYDADGNEVSDD